jgi:hypothetical protein
MSRATRPIALMRGTATKRRWRQSREGNRETTTNATSAVTTEKAVQPATRPDADLAVAIQRQKGTAAKITTGRKTTAMARRTWRVRSRKGDDDMV